MFSVPLTYAGEQVCDIFDVAKTKVETGVDGIF